LLWLRAKVPKKASNPFSYTIFGTFALSCDNTRLDNDLTRGTADIITKILENEREQAIVNIHNFLRSVWIERLDTKDSGDSANPRYNVYANGAIIHKDDLWMNL